MRLPRDVSGRYLVTKLAALGYRITRQSGSHIRLTTELNGEHQLTIPDHDFLRIGTLSAILTEVQNHHKLSRDDVLDQLFSG